MNFRLFSHKHRLYTNSSFWRSNQRSCSDWVITPEGNVLEIVWFNDRISPFIKVDHDKQNFSIEAWTGFFDSKGRKIYRGDILEMASFFDFKSEVIWKEGAFWLKTLDSEGFDQQFTGLYSKDWTITGNIHNVEFCY